MSQIKNKKITLKTIAVCFMVLLMSSICMNSSSIGQNSNDVTVIKDVRIFDGERIIRQGAVLVKDGKITEVGREIAIPDKAELIDGKGQTLLPGLIDSHMHVFYPQVLKQHLIFGVTTVVDMNMMVKTMQDIKKLQGSGKTNDMASLISAGAAATVPGGHVTQYGKVPTLSTPEEAQGFVDARIAEGSDFIKIIYDDGSLFSNELPTFDKETLAAVIEAAHKRGKLAVVHAMTLREAKEVIEAGADGLAHLYCDDAADKDFGRMVARHKAFVIPTLTVLESICGISGASSLVEDARLSPYLKQVDIASLQRPFPVKVKNAGAGYKAAEKALQQLKKAGVPILAGTDTLNPGTAYGVSLHRELELLVQAGLSPVEALKAATSIPAKIFNLKDRGQVKPGLNADLLLVRGDPTRDIMATRDIVAVWKNGVKVDREAYLSSVQKDREEVEHLKSSPPPAGSESGMISDFEAEKITTNFGTGWVVSTDAMRGGKSKAEFHRVEGGFQGSSGSMLVTGTIFDKGPFTWAGVQFSPGRAPMSPVNLSSWKAISFWAKGEGKSFSIMIFTRSFGFSPSIQAFVVGKEWKHFVFPFEKFGTDGHDIWGVFIGGAAQPGDFTLQIDNVRLE